MDAEEQELDEKVAEITTQISSKLGVAHYSAEDAEDEKRELNYEAIIEAKTKVKCSINKETCHVVAVNLAIGIAIKAFLFVITIE